MAATNTVNGRQYHTSSSAYVLPNDALEQQRLDSQATAIVEMLGGLPFLALSEDMQQVSKVVDIGCGTGVATVQLAGHFPSAKVFGLDISPVPATMRESFPKNPTWIVGNILDVDPSKPGDNAILRELFKLNKLDYIFGRMLFLGINDWSRFFDVAKFSLRPGGIIEHQDLDLHFYRVGSSQILSGDWEWHRAFLSAAEKSGLSTRSGSDVARILKQKGLDILSVRTFEFSFVPSTRTPNSQAMGQYVQAKLIPNFPELLRRLLGSQGIAGQELQRLTTDCLRDLSSEEGLHQRYTVTVATKPDKC